MLGSAYCWRSYLRAMTHFGALCAVDVVIGALGIYLWARRSYGATIHYNYWPLRVNAVDTSEVGPGTRRRALLLVLSGASRAICIGQAPFACLLLRARLCVSLIRAGQMWPLAWTGFRAMPPALFINILSLHPYLVRGRWPTAHLRTRSTLQRPIVGQSV